MGQFVMLFRPPLIPLTPADQKRRADEIRVWARAQNGAGLRLDPRALDERVHRLAADEHAVAWSDPGTLSNLLFFEARDFADAVRIAETHPGIRYGAIVEVRAWSTPLSSSAETKAPVPEEPGAERARPIVSAYAEVNGLQLYHEIYGAGEPVVLLPGGLMTIAEMSPLIRTLAEDRQVIAVELQGHGRTADTERPLSRETMGDDVATLIESLGVGRADLVGYSLGGHVALRTAIQHPELVRRLVVVSTPAARLGWNRDARDLMGRVSSEAADRLRATPTGIATRYWPRPASFPRFLDKLGAMLAEEYDWSADIRRLTLPVMLAFADHDSISPRHIAEFFALLPDARLAILPGYSHYDVASAPELGSIVERFLAAPDSPKAQAGDGPAAYKAVAGLS